nr:MAG TPA: Transcription initiation factor IIE, alpha FINGER, Transcription [Caudoviricetes sp.]
MNIIFFECMVCHKDVCGNCAKQMMISFCPLDTFPCLLNLCPHCFKTLTLKKLEELEHNEK